MKAENFSTEIREAVAAYDRYVVCIDKTPDQFQSSLHSLVAKAIKVYENRAPGLKHGIALDSQVTIILSEPPESAAEIRRPLCGIYFNLHSPYRRKTVPVKAGS
ncbi:MAG: hypothetical protein HZA91_10645 [Verrucomicrobia bacterium]|nr:hypothetical protein [Verrucomicrobiota bacterium]